jgi:hypothetical protein
MINQPGIYMVNPNPDASAGRRLGETKNGGLVFEIECVMEDGTSIWATQYLTKKDGSRNEFAFETLRSVFGWDGEDFEKLMSERIPPFQIDVQPNDKGQLEVKWINQIGGRRRQPTDLQSVKNRFAHLLNRKVPTGMPPEVEAWKEAKAQADYNRQNAFIQQDAGKIGYYPPSASTMPPGAFRYPTPPPPPPLMANEGQSGYKQPEDEIPF